jgi:lipopolysaccharide transport system ATP-binding protein
LRGLGKYYKRYEHPWRRLLQELAPSDRGQVHWVLRGLDLDLKPGDCLGIIGRNGAGKSTLLDLVCGVRRPSEGVVDVSGRIAAMLQLGAGFNPEFSGRENVVLAAALYGLSSSQTAERLSAIETFAGIGEFFDRPVREYSSGMYARLAFSVCAHVDADVLVIDEILGVGDVRFQQQSMRFLFVSHDEHAVSALCNGAIWIDKGRLIARGATRDVLHRYRREMSRLMAPDSDFLASGTVDPSLDMQAVGSTGARDDASPRFDPDDYSQTVGGGEIETVHLANVDGTHPDSLSGGEDLRLTILCRARAAFSSARMLFTLRNPMGQIVFSGHSSVGGREPGGLLRPGSGLECEFDFRLPYLPTGNYPLAVFFLSESNGQVQCVANQDDAVIMRVLSQHVSSGMANLRMERTELLIGSEVG